MITKKKYKPRGILKTTSGENKFTENLFLPSDDVAFFVEHFWAVQWNLPGGKPFTAETLPHPCVHIVFEKDSATVVGVVKGKFTRSLTGKGKVLGIKFRPGAFYPFVNRPISEFTNRVLPLENVLGKETAGLHKKILAHSSPRNGSPCGTIFTRATAAAG